MGEIIDFGKAREERLAREREEQLLLEKTEKAKNSRFTVTLSVEEAYILLDRMIEFTKMELVHLNEDYQEAEEIKWAKRVIRYNLRMAQRLLARLENAPPYEELKISWSDSNLYYAMVALEMSVSYFTRVEGYDTLEKERKVEIHLYYRLQELYEKRLAITDPHHPRLELVEEPEIFQKERMITENLKNINEYKFQQEFLQKVILLEESHVYMGDDLLFSSFYVQQFPKEFLPKLKELKKRGDAEYCSKAVIEVEADDEDLNMYRFSHGWRIHVSGGEDIINSPIKKGFQVEIISTESQDELADHYEWRWDDLTDVLMDFVELCVEEGIIRDE